MLKAVPYFEISVRLKRPTSVLPNIGISHLSHGIQSVQVLIGLVDAVARCVHEVLPTTWS